MIYILDTNILIYLIRENPIIKAEIDTYSKGKFTERPLPTGLTARKMGKNDLWIAATTYLTKATVITNDNDFDHLNGVYFPVIKLPTL